MPRIAIWLFQSKGLGPRVIQAQTWRRVNHSAFEFVDNELVIDAGLRAGVQMKVRHDAQLLKGVVGAWRFEFEVSNESYQSAMTFAMAHVGDRYDWASLIAFVPTLRRLFKRTDPTVRDGSGKWICSELTEVLCRKAGIHLIRLETPPAVVSPGDLWDSVRLDMADKSERWEDGEWHT